MLAQPLQPKDISAPEFKQHGAVIPAPPRYEDVMGQFPQLMSYNHGAAIFKLDEAISQEKVVADVKSAVGRIVDRIPWLGQRVVRENVQQGASGVFKVAPWPNPETAPEVVRVKDCTEDCPSYEELAAEEAPIQKLDGKILCPVPGFPARYDESVSGPPAACIIQINFIKGGAILVFSNQHNVMDGTGIFQVIRLLSVVMSGGDLSADDIEQGNRDRKTVIPLYPSDVPIRDHEYLRAKPIQSRPIPPAKWVQIRFLKSALPRIKKLANDPAGYDKAVPFISTGDAVTALYWKCLARARMRNGQNPATISRISRAIDSRTVMRVPYSYMGQMVYSSRTYLTHAELAYLPLSTVACAMRATLNKDNTEHSIRSFATYISGVADKMTLTYAGPKDQATDISTSSMATAALVLEFGVLGEPKFIRRPNLAPINGTLYFYPPEASGDLNLLVCLNDYELNALREDDLWGECTKFIG
jgi:trichothecene 3-O-acetyltransferase